ncbi:MAG: aspartate ammonia-lyase [Bacteroidales bacterium]|nr:aspartate ammonia-lyase [Candidatus Equimonas faecalis]
MAEKNYRLESDLLGELQVPAERLYGVQTQRACNNYKISHTHMYDYPDYIKAMGYVKLGAAQANKELGVLDAKIADAIIAVCRELIAGKHRREFPVDMMQGGAGTSVNMNANEVIANRALELMGKKRGEYKYCSPNDHVNCAQSTNDAYPCAIRLGLILMNKRLERALKTLVKSFRQKGVEFDGIIKMGRTQLQDAVPMTCGQEFTAFANTLADEVANLHRNADLLHTINMGATAIGTGLNAVKGYAELCTRRMTEAFGEELYLASDLIAATPDTADYVAYSGALKRLAVKLSKICNDLRLMASGPRCGLHEINLPPMAPGSSIMPGKVNPVIPEVTNQVCFKVIGNDTAVSFAAEAGQLQLNVMEPVIAQCIMESIEWLINAMNTLRTKCVDGITVNAEHTKEMVMNSIGIVTAFNPHIGYKASTKIAKEALVSGKSVAKVAEEQGLSKKDIKAWLDPTTMLGPSDK